MNERPNMKKMIAGVLVVAFVGALAPKARAHDSGWAVAGAVLAGVTVGAVAASGGSVCIASPPPVVYAPPPPRPVVYVPPPPRVVYVSPPVIYAPRPVVVAGPLAYARPTPVLRTHPGYGHGYHHFHPYGHR